MVLNLVGVVAYLRLHGFLTKKRGGVTIMTEARILGEFIEWPYTSLPIEA